MVSSHLPAIRFSFVAALGLYVEMGGRAGPYISVGGSSADESTVRKEFAAARQVGRTAAIAKEKVWNKLSLSVTIETSPKKL